MKPYYITTPIYYVNDKPHIGHAYTTVAADVMARFQSLNGRKTHFLTGTDEHGQKVEKSAEQKGIAPQAFTDEVSQSFYNLANDLNCSHNQFIRTTEQRHKHSAQALWQRLQEKGHIYLDSYAGWYAVRDEAFYQENELITQDGEKIAPTGAAVEWVEEPSYFFNLSQWGDALLKHYHDNSGFIMPESRKNEVMRFVEGGLKDLSVSRTTFKWGIPVPGDDAHIMYVWLDALTNYITALDFPDEKSDLYQTFWPASLHLVGKDILRFHAVYWPAFLMAAELPLPQRIFAHGWWTNEGQKISKSLGNVIDPYDLIEKYGLDQTRYFMMREVPFGGDGDFSHDQMVMRMNSDLANTVGNLAQRTLSFIQKNGDGVVPKPSDYNDEDNTLLKQGEDLWNILQDHYDNQRLHKAAESVIALAMEANRYIDVMAPWTLKKTDRARMETVLYVLVETIRHVGWGLLPIMPKSAEKLLLQLGVTKDTLRSDPLNPGDTLPTPAPIFKRFESNP